MYVAIYGNTYHEIIDSNVNRIIENINNQTSFEQNMILLSNRIIS